MQGRQLPLFKALKAILRTGKLFVSSRDINQMYARSLGAVTGLY
jgi:hypothetical protein